MAVLRYITLNGKRYRTANRSFQHKAKKARQINVTLSGKTQVQTFSFTSNRWQMTILVEYTPADSAYGSWNDLLAAHEAAYVPLVDLFGVNQGNVIFEGELEEIPVWALIDQTVPFEVSITLVKRQT